MSQERNLEAPCPRCGKEVYYTFTFCPFCGLPVQTRVESVPVEVVEPGGNKNLSEEKKRLLAEFDRQFEEMKLRVQSKSGSKRKTPEFEINTRNMAILAVATALFLFFIWYVLAVIYRAALVK